MKDPWISDNWYLSRFNFVPEVTKENLSVKLDEEAMVLTISGKASKETTADKANYYCKEVSERAFSRCVRLPDEVEVAKIDSSHKDGMLKIVIPYKTDRVKKDKSRVIDIK